MALRRVGWILTWAAVSVGLAAQGCASSGHRLAALMPGVVNDPKNRTMRREMMGFGSAEFCKELLRRGAPLKLRDDFPSVGRFFVDQCDFKQLDNEDAFVQFAGHGYAWTQPTGRIGFKASGAMQYNPDFLLHEGAMYAYFRPRNIQSNQFQALMVEGAASGIAGAAFQAVGGDELANRVGAQILAQELSRGFTVIREDNGSVDFGLGTIEKGRRPFHPYTVHGSEKISLAIDTTEVHEQQREYLGPFEIDEDNRALYLTMSLDGVPAVDVMVLRKEPGQLWLGDYIFRPALTAPQAPPLMSDVLPGKTEWKRTVPLARGLYYVVIDNTRVAGPVSPPPSQPGVLAASDQVGVVRYVVQVGDAP